MTDDEWADRLKTELSRGMAESIKAGAMDEVAASTGCIAMLSAYRSVGVLSRFRASFSELHPELNDILENDE